MPPKKAPIVKLPPVLPKGHVIFDKNKKKHWTLVRQLGTGGFGRIYEVNCPETSEIAVIKMEHLDSGPLFCEQNFAVRCLKKGVLQAWMKSRNVDHVALPEFFSFGVTDDSQFRFVVMQRLGRNLEDVLTGFEWHLPEVLTYQIAIEMVNALQFIHVHGFVHADVKGSNIIFGHGSAESKSIYLCDFGLAAKVPLVYKEDKKLKHNGTIEYTSREAHRGAPPSPRGDMEILAYCLLHWMKGSLPWGAQLANPDAVSSTKHGFFEKLPKSLIDYFPECPPELIEFFTFISRLPYETAPDYNAMRKIFSNGLAKRKAHVAPPFNLEVKKIVKAKSVTSPRLKAKNESVVVPPSPVTVAKAASPKPKYKVTSGPLAVAMARSRLAESPARVQIHEPTVSRQNSASDRTTELKRKHVSPINSASARVPMKQKTPLSGKPCVARNQDAYGYDSDEDDRSILYKTALPEFMPTSSEDDDDSDEDFKPTFKPTVRNKKALSTRK